MAGARPDLPPDPVPETVPGTAGPEEDGPAVFLRQAFLQRQGHLSLAHGALAGIAVGLPVLTAVLGGDPSIGFTIALGALMTTFVDGAFPYRRRAAILTIAAGGYAIAMAVGTLAGTTPWAAVVVTAGWALVATYSGAFDPQFDPVGLVTTMIVLIGTAAPGDWRFALRQGLLILAGGAWCGALTLMASRGRREGPPGIAAAAALDATARALHTLAAADPHRWTAPTFRRDLRAVLTELRTRIGDLRDATQATYGRNVTGARLRVLALALERTASRISALVEAIAVATDGSDALRHALGAVLVALAQEVAHLAEVVRQRRPVPGPITRPDASLADGRAAQHQARDALVAEVDATRLARLRQPAMVPVMADLGVIVRAVERLGDAVDLAVDTVSGAVSVMNMNRPDAAAAGRRRLAQVLQPHLSWQAPRTRLALRVLVATAIGEAVVQASGVSHGIWLVLTALVILRTDRATTWTRAAQRVAGTVVGACITALLLGVVTDQITLAIVIGLLSALSIPLLRVNYGYFVALFTPTVLLLIDVSSTDTWRTAAARVLLTLAGGALAVIVDALVWPARTAEQLPVRLAEVIAATGRYLDTVLAGYASGKGDWEALVRARRRAEAAYALAADTATRLAGGPRQERRAAARLAPALEAALELLRAVRAAALDATSLTGRPAASEASAAEMPIAAQPPRTVAGEAELQALAGTLRAEATAVFAALTKHAAAVPLAAAAGTVGPVIQADAAGPLVLPRALDGWLEQLYRARATEIAGGVDLLAVTPLRSAVQRWHDLVRYLQRIEDRVGRLDATLAQLSQPGRQPVTAQGDGPAAAP